MHIYNIIIRFGLYMVCVDCSKTCREAPSVSSCLVQKEVAGSHVQVQGEANAIEARGSKELPNLIFPLSGSSLFTTDSLVSADNASCSGTIIPFHI